MVSCKFNESSFVTRLINSPCRVTVNSSGSDLNPSVLPSPSSSSKIGAIVGGVVGGVVGASLIILVLFCWRRRAKAHGVRVLDLADEAGSGEGEHGLPATPVNYSYVVTATSPSLPQLHFETPPVPIASTIASEKCPSRRSGQIDTRDSMACSSSAPSGSRQMNSPTSPMMDTGMMREVNELREEIARMRMHEAARDSVDRISITEVLDAAPPPDYDEPSHSRFMEQGRSEGSSKVMQNASSEAVIHDEESLPHRGV